ncbi:MAG: hypothetical protein ACSLFN_12735 [Candidatus Limnocylindrales bacterium]
MPEILTESFCERCGTRYTFESAAPRAAKLKGIRVLSRGLKNFVMSDDSSMDEAMAAARSETDREQTSQQLDAFHKTFNFCMTCRQYTCGNCWNEAEGRCLTCAPHLGHEIMPAPFPDLPAGSPFGLENGNAGAHATNGLHADDGSNGHGHADLTDALAWPTMDLERDDATALEADGSDIEPIDASARLAAIGAYGAEPPVEAAIEATNAIEATEEVEASADAPIETDTEAEANAVVEIEAETPVAANAELQPIIAAEPPVPPTRLAPSPSRLDPADVPGRAAAAAAQTTDLLRRFRPGQNLDAEIEAYEREQHGAPIEPVAPPVQAPEPVMAEAPVDEPGSVVAEPEPVLAEAEAEPEPVFAEASDAEPESVVAPEPLAAAAPPTTEPAPEPAPAVREDVVPQPTWRIVAPEAQPATPPVAPSGQPASPDAVSASAAPEWPTQPEWPSERPASGLAFLGRPALPTGGLDSLWAESAREVAAPTTPLTLGGAPARGASGGVQPCVSCGLSLSATARFCRRCGTPQG